MFGDTASSKGAGPQSTGLNFPTFLLPNFRLPFRRNTVTSPARRDSTGDATSAAAVPSLSSSPAASSPAESPPSPYSAGSFFPDYEDPALAAKAKAIHAPARGSRLARTSPDTLRCSTCSTDLAFGAQIVSKGFTGRHGRAYLVSPPSALPTPSCPSSPTNALAQAMGHGQHFEDLVNIRVGRSENRQLVTGAHVVADISCSVCGVKLGWKYVDAKEPAQKYKVGKFILETQRVIAYRSWEDTGPECASAAPESAGREDDRRKSSSARSRDSGNLTLGDAEGDDEVVVFDSDDEDECDDIFAGTWDPEIVAQRRRSRLSALRK